MRLDVAELFAKEQALGVDSSSFYDLFAERVQTVKDELTRFVHERKQAGKTLAAYGAAAKGSTLLNFCGLNADSIDFVADRSFYKQGRLMPGVHVPIVPADELTLRKPDYTLLLTWNFAEEILLQQRAYTDGGGSFVVPIPSLAVVK